MKSLDTCLNENEKSCAFISKEHESQKTELKNAKKNNLGDLQKSCKNLESEAVSMKTKQDTLNMKLNDLEARSVRENLMFYGIPGRGRLRAVGQKPLYRYVKNERGHRAWDIVRQGSPVRSETSL